MVANILLGATLNAQRTATLFSVLTLCVAHSTLCKSGRAIDLAVKKLQDLIIVRMICDFFDVFDVLHLVVRSDHKNGAREKL